MNILIVLSLTTCILLLSAMPVGAQFSVQELQRDMQNVGTIVKAYYKETKSLPADTASYDKLLYHLYKRSRQYDPNQPLPYPTSDGTYRVLGRFKVTFDLAINQESNTLILWRKNPPDSWTGGGGQIGIVTNGDKKFLLYGIGENGRPITSSTGLTVYDIYDCETGEEDERVL